ncbi:S24/S26 family peptidase [Sphingobacterium bovistauri]|uniref:S24/S26 family peptidase n=1 Tax=Sphingobacterium bovistauri TaxID=2781959 RepID=A0ABS7Z3G5_9SPHI|nr:S24/S26 family peptidase [Sphingobacterium bovistauri]MCA5004127.1 S24/S26 family peptidase [Sphingobacterium bovistauri]
MQNAKSKEGTLLVKNNVFFKEVKTLLDIGNDVSFRIKGNSMLPFLSNGNKVLIRRATKEDLKYGKIILAKSDFGYVLHRLVWKNSRWIWLAGDNNLVQLEKIDIKNILGYVVSAESEDKKIDVDSYSHKFFSFIWFILRPIRLVIHYITKIIKSK